MAVQAKRGTTKSVQIMTKPRNMPSIVVEIVGETGVHMQRDRVEEPQILWCGMACAR